MLMLLMVVAAGSSIQMYYAYRVPVVRTEVNSWFGVTAGQVDISEARQSHLTFLMLLYAVPLGLALLTYCIYFSSNLYHQFQLRNHNEEDAQFRMD